MAMYWVPLYLVLLVLIFWQFWRWKNRRLLKLAAMVPGPPALPIIGNALFFMTNPGESLNKIAGILHKYGDYVRFWLGPELMIIVKNPADVRHLLTSNKVNQKGPSYDFMKSYIGSGILTGGPNWRNYRKIATPTYNKKSVNEYTSIFNKEAEALIKVLGKKTPGVPFNIYTDVVQTTTQCVCQTLMGLSKSDTLNLQKLQYIIYNTPRIYDFVFTIMTRWWLQIPLIFWLVGGKRQQDTYIKNIDEFISDIVSKRRLALAAKKQKDEDIMGITDRYILCGELSEKDIKNESFSLFTTSQEASAKITSGLLLFLSLLPDWQDKVYNEIIEVLGPEDSDVTMEQVKELHYLDMVYKETLRYLSIAALVQRTVEEEVVIKDGEITLPVGTTLTIPIHEMHRDPKYWEDPLVVKPERFLPENVKRRDPNAFVPFSLGPMDCLGRVYATALIKILVIRLLRHMKLEPVGTQDDIRLKVAISVEVAGGYNVRIRPRT